MTSPQGSRRVRGDAGVTRGGRGVKKLGFWGNVIYGWSLTYKTIPYKNCTVLSHKEKLTKGTNETAY